MTIEPLILRRADFGWKNENDYDALEDGVTDEIRTSFNLNSMYLIGPLSPLPPETWLSSSSVSSRVLLMSLVSLICRLLQPANGSSSRRARPHWRNALAAPVNPFTDGTQIRHFVMVITNRSPRYEYIADYSISELRKEAEASKAASIEMETSTSRFVMRNIDPVAARTLRDFAAQVIDARDGGAVWLSGPAGTAWLNVATSRAPQHD
jgi:hypothetical protein